MPTCLFCFRIISYPIFLWVIKKIKILCIISWGELYEVWGSKVCRNIIKLFYDWKFLLLIIQWHAFFWWCALSYVCDIMCWGQRMHAGREFIFWRTNGASSWFKMWFWAKSLIRVSTGTSLAQAKSSGAFIDGVSLMYVDKLNKISITSSKECLKGRWENSNPLRHFHMGSHKKKRHPCHIKKNLEFYQLTIATFAILRRKTTHINLDGSRYVESMQSMLLYEAFKFLIGWS